MRRKLMRYAWESEEMRRGGNGRDGLEELRGKEVLKGETTSTFLS
jgi:hypothetical protein